MSKQRIIAFLVVLVSTLSLFFSVYHLEDRRERERERLNSVTTSDWYKAAKIAHLASLEINR